MIKGGDSQTCWEHKVGRKLGIFGRIMCLLLQNRGALTSMCRAGDPPSPDPLADTGTFYNHTSGQVSPSS